MKRKLEANNEDDHQVEMQSSSEVILEPLQQCRKLTNNTSPSNNVIIASSSLISSNFNSNDDDNYNYLCFEKPVTVILSDFKLRGVSYEGELPQQHCLLTRKFQLQSKGKIKWIEERCKMFNRDHSFIPIEFCYDKELVYNMAKTIDLEEHIFDCIPPSVVDADLFVRVTDRLVNGTELGSILLQSKLPPLLRRCNIKLEAAKSPEAKCYVAASELIVSATDQDRDDPDKAFEMVTKLTEKLSFLPFISQRLQNDVDFIYRVFKHYKGDSGMLDIVSPFCTTKELVFKFAEINPQVLSYIPSKLRDDPNFISEVISVNTDYLGKLSSALYHHPIAKVKEKKCKEILSDNVLREKMENNIEFILQYCAVHPKLFYLISPKLLAEKSILLKILEKIEKCSFRLSFVFDHVPESMRDDFEILQKAMDIDYRCFRHASEKLSRDIEFVKQSLVRYHDVLYHMIAPELLADRKHLLELVSVSGEILRHAPAAFQDDEKVVIQALKNTGTAIYHVSLRLRNDRNFLLWAKKKTSLHINDLSSSVADEEFILESFESPFVEDLYDEIEYRGLLDNYKFMKEALKKGYEYSEFPDKFKQMKEFSLLAVSVCGTNLKYANHKDEWDVQKEAVKQNGYFINISPQLLEYRLECEYFGCKIDVD